MSARAGPNGRPLNEEWQEQRMSAVDKPETA